MNGVTEYPCNSYIRHLLLTVQQLGVDMLLDTDGVKIPERNILAHHQWSLETMVTHLRLSLKTPAQVLQDRRLIAQYPDGLWQHIRQSLGLKARVKQIRMNEWLCFPTVEVPELHGHPLKIYAKMDVTTWDQRIREEDE